MKLYTVNHQVYTQHVPDTYMPDKFIPYDYDNYQVISPDNEIIFDEDGDEAKTKAYQLADSQNVILYRHRNMELEAALAVTTESLNKANYEKYLLELESDELGKTIVQALNQFYGNDTSTALNRMVNILEEANDKIRAKRQAKQAPVSSDSDEQASGFVGKPVNIKKLLTRNHEPMATMEINGLDCVAFPRTWMKYRELLESGNELQIVATEDNSKGSLQYIIDSVEEHL